MNHHNGDICSIQCLVALLTFVSMPIENKRRVALITLLVLHLLSSFQTTTAFVTPPSHCDVHRKSLYMTNANEPEHHQAVDDDDVSQHEFMIPKANNGYRPIEEWHEEHVEKNPQQVLRQLQSEKARWNKKFESISGEGI